MNKKSECGFQKYTKCTKYRNAPLILFSEIKDDKMCLNKRFTPKKKVVGEHVWRKTNGFILRQVV